MEYKQNKQVNLFQSENIKEQQFILNRILDNAF